MLTPGQQKRWLLAEGKWEVVAVTPESPFLEVVTHRQVVGTKLLSGAELVACALGHMPSKLTSAAALSHAGRRWCSCPGSEQTLLPQVSEHEQLNCVHFLHTCLDYVVEAQKSLPGPCKMWNKSFLSICLAATLPAPNSSLRNTLLFFLMLIRRHRGKERKAGGCSGQAGPGV